MIHYHVTPIGGTTVAFSRIMHSKFALVSFARPDQLNLVLEYCSGFILDNGAFSAWKRGEQIDWNDYARWVKELSSHPGYQFSILPDVINGTEEENDELLQQYKLPCGVPVFHQGESLARLNRLAQSYSTVAISSVEKSIPSISFNSWINGVFQSLTDELGVPRVKVHGLRMLNPEIFTRFPFASADSSYLGQTCADEGKFTGSLRPISTEVRGAVLLDRVESYQSPGRYIPPKEEQLDLFGVQ
jgi:hypothetical protein